MELFFLFPNDVLNKAEWETQYMRFSGTLIKLPASSSWLYWCILLGPIRISYDNTSWLNKLWHETINSSLRNMTNEDILNHLWSELYSFPVVVFCPVQFFRFSERCSRIENSLEISRCQMSCTNKRLGRFSGSRHIQQELAWMIDDEMYLRVSKAQSSNPRHTHIFRSISNMTTACRRIIWYAPFLPSFARPP